MGDRRREDRNEPRGAGGGAWLIRLLRTAFPRFVAAAGFMVASTGALAPASAQLPAANSPYFYTYHETTTPLAVSTTHLAVHRADQRIDGVREATTRRGISADRVRPTAIEGWFRVDLDGVAASDRTVLDLTRSLRADDSIDFVSPVFVDSDSNTLTPTRDLLLRLDPALTASAAEEIVSVAGTQVRVIGADVRLVRTELRSGLEVLELANALATGEGVLSAEPDSILSVRFDSLPVPDDPYYPSLWGLNDPNGDIDLDAPEAWQLADLVGGATKIKVAVFDSGVQLDHPDLPAVHGIDVTSQNHKGGPGNKCDNHGTMVAGCVAAIRDNALGVVGMSPDIELWSIRFMISNVPCDGSGTGKASWIVEGLQKCMNNGVHITNMSNAFAPSISVAAMYDATHAEGMMHFAASGNESASSVGFPSLIASVEAVGAITPGGNKAWFSNTGSELDFVGPGTDIWTTDRTGSKGADGQLDYVETDGTSFASPYVAGVAALIRSVNPSLSPSQVRAAMISTAKDLGAQGFDTSFGYGLPSAEAALLKYAFSAPKTTDPDFTLAEGVPNVHVAAGLPVTSYEYASFGYSSSMSEGRLLIGSPKLSAPYGNHLYLSTGFVSTVNGGDVYLFDKSAGGWNLEKSFNAQSYGFDAGQFGRLLFGQDVALDGGRIAALVTVTYDALQPDDDVTQHWVLILEEGPQPGQWTQTGKIPLTTGSYPLRHQMSPVPGFRHPFGADSHYGANKLWPFDNRGSYEGDLYSGHTSLAWTDHGLVVYEWTDVGDPANYPHNAPASVKIRTFVKSGPNWSEAAPIDYVASLPQPWSGTVMPAKFDADSSTLAVVLNNTQFDKTDTNGHTSISGDSLDVYEWNGIAWNLKANIPASSGPPPFNSNTTGWGSDVAVADDLIAVSAPKAVIYSQSGTSSAPPFWSSVSGTVEIYRRSPTGQWESGETVIPASPTDFSNPAYNYGLVDFGARVALDGTQLLASGMHFQTVGTPGNYSSWTPVSYSLFPIDLTDEGSVRGSPVHMEQPNGSYCRPAEYGGVGAIPFGYQYTNPFIALDDGVAAIERRWVLPESGGSYPFELPGISEVAYNSIKLYELDSQVTHVPLELGQTLVGALESADEKHVASFFGLTDSKISLTLKHDKDELLTLDLVDPTGHTEGSIEISGKPKGFTLQHTLLSTGLYELIVRSPAGLLESYSCKTGVKFGHLAKKKSYKISAPSPADVIEIPVQVMPGASLSATIKRIKGPKATLSVAMVGPTNSSVDLLGAMSTGSSGTVKIKSLPMPDGGTYKLRISGLPTASAKWKVTMKPKQPTQGSGSVVVP